MNLRVFVKRGKLSDIIKLLKLMNEIERNKELFRGLYE